MANHSPPKPNTRLADLGLVYAAAIWGSTFIIVKDALEDINPVVMVGYRCLLAAIGMGAYLLLARKPFFKDFKAGALIGIVLLFLYVPQTVGLGYTSAANSAFITGLFVAFVPFFSLLFRLKPTPAQWAAVAISLAGLWLLTGGLAQVNPGDLITLSAAAAYAAHIFIADRYVNAQIDPFVFSFQQFFVVGVLSLGLAALLGLPFSVHSQQARSAVLFLAIFPSLTAFVIQFKAQRITSPAKVALIFALEPVFGAFFAWTFGGEPFVPTRAAGGSLIFAAILVSTLPPRKPKVN